MSLPIPRLLYHLRSRRSVLAHRPTPSSMSCSRSPEKRSRVFPALRLLKGSIKTGNTDQVIDVGLSGATIYGSESLPDVSDEPVPTMAKNRREVSLQWTFEHLRIRYKLSDLITPEAFLSNINSTRFRAIKFRGLVGLGAAFTLWEEDAGHAVFGTTYMLEREVASGEADQLEFEKTRMASVVKLSPACI